MSSVSIAAALTFDTADYAAIVGVNSDPIRRDKLLTVQGLLTSNS